MVCISNVFSVHGIQYITILVYSVSTKKNAPKVHWCSIGNIWQTSLKFLHHNLAQWTVCIQDKNQIAIVYHDFHKAFHVVSHTKLMLRLSHYYIRESVLSWL